MRTRFVMAAVAVVFLAALLAKAEPAVSHPPDESAHRWKVSGASFYGPGFYGRRTACGQTMTKQLMGTAHKTLACGTLVRFEWHGTQVVVPVVDRGPYAAGREWDLTAATCYYLTQHSGRERCNSGAIAWTR